MVLRPPLALLLILALIPASHPARSQGRTTPIVPVRFTDVRVDDEFWSKRLEINRTVSIPHALAQCEQTGRVRNFETADSILRGVIREGKFCGRYGFDDSDVYKVIEGASYALHTRYDAALDARVDTLIEKIGKAQEADGYLYTMRTIKPEASWAPERWVNDRMKGSHELYNSGHLYEAAVAHFYATGKRSLLDIALKNADLLVETFGPDRMHTVPGHEVTEIGLVKLFQVTAKRKYLELADFFIRERGHGSPEGGSYNQDHIPVLEQTEAVGHAVRAGYLFAGMADVAALKEDSEYMPVLERIWNDVVSHKLYVTGGVGAVGKIEGYGPAYELPNLSAYCETCAGIALVYWNHRMFLHSGDAKYLDIVERVIYNGFLSGVSMTGDRFFYPNPLESIAGAERAPWFTCACCPSNDVRFVASLPGYAYATTGKALFVNLYMGGTASVHMADHFVQVRQRTRYPWAGNVSMTLGLSAPDSFSLKLRIPGWALGHPVPSLLYVYDDSIRAAVTIAVNGVAQRLVMENGFAVLERSWRSGDRIDLSLPMPVQRVRAHENIVDDRGKVAFERGPIVFCLEGPDQPDPWLLDSVIPDTAVIQSSFNRTLLGGVQVLTGTALSSRRTANGGREIGPAKHFVAIPYYAWSHRGQYQMTVWPARTLDAAKPAPAPTLAYKSALATSGGSDPEAIKDQLLPSSSNDGLTPYFHWWPKKGSTEWVQYHFPESGTVSAVTVHWFDDTGEGECRLPASWEIQYHDGTSWRPVANPSSMECVLNVPSHVTFDPVLTTDIRLMITLPSGFSSGLYEWSLD
jgi:uncharacterized protein